MTTVRWWRISRILHATLWFAVIAYYFYFWIDQKDHFNQLGQLRLSTEVLMFGLPIAAVCMGFFQMAMRDRAGVPRHPAPIIPLRQEPMEASRDREIAGRPPIPRARPVTQGVVA
jgi:hypothetical protein